MLGSPKIEHDEAKQVMVTIFIRCKSNELSCLTNLIFTTLQTSCFVNDVSVRKPKIDHDEANQVMVTINKKISAQRTNSQCN